MWLDSNLKAFLSGKTYTNITHSYSSWTASDCFIFNIFAISPRGQEFNISVISRAFAFYELLLYLN